MPSRSLPDYRHHRGHTGFCHQSEPGRRLKSATAGFWNAAERLQEVPDREALKLAAEKYSTAGLEFQVIARHFSRLLFTIARCK